MSKTTLVVEGLSDEREFPLTMLANMMGEAARRLEALEENMVYPVTIVVKREQGHLKLSAVRHPQYEAALSGQGQELTVGYYVPTPEFRAIPEHTAVMDAATRGLVATTGPAGDATSEADARLFAVARRLLNICRITRLMFLPGGSLTEAESERLASLRGETHAQGMDEWERVVQEIETAVTLAGENFLP